MAVLTGWLIDLLMDWHTPETIQYSILTIVSFAGFYINTWFWTKYAIPEIQKRYKKKSDKTAASN